MAKRRPSGDGMVRQRSDGRWEGRIVVGHKENGTPIFRYMSAKTQKDLMEKLHRSIDEYDGAELTEDSRMTLGEWLDIWLEECAKPSVRANTFKGYQGYIERNIKPSLGGKQIGKITAAEIQSLYRKLQKEGGVDGGPLSGSTVRRIHNVLHQALDVATNRHLIVKNPSNDVTLPKKTTTVKTILNDEQLERFMEAIKADEHWHDFFYLEITTGLRRGELCGLMWTDFDEKKGTISIRRTLHTKAGGGYYVSDTKTATGRRSIKLPPSTVQLLKDRKKKSISQWVFANPIHPEDPVMPNSGYHRMKKLLKQAGLPNLRFHDLRHTFATHALQESYRRWIEVHIIPAIGRIPLNKLTQADCQKFLNALKSNGRKIHRDSKGAELAEKSVRNCYHVLKMSLDRAVTDGLIKKNPAIGCKLPPLKTKEMKILSKEEIQRFMVQAKEEGLYELFLLELTTGLRRGEILALTWDDLNVKTGELRINKQFTPAGGKATISEPKTKAAFRTIVLPPVMVELLMEYKKGVFSHLMFPSRIKPEQPIDPGYVRKRLQQILKRADCKRVRFHDLRHTFATMSLEYGMDVKTLSTIIGHVSSQTTLNIYTHITGEMQENAADRIDRGIAKVEVVERAETENSIETQQFEPVKPSRRRPGTGYIKQLNDNLWEGRYSPVWPDGKKYPRNIYAPTQEECEEKLAELILQTKAEIAKLRSGKAMEYPDGISAKKKQLAAYLKENPGVSNKSFIAQQLGMDRTTVRRYYDEVCAELAAPVPPPVAMPNQR